jgi:hypothetical protein
MIRAVLCDEEDTDTALWTTAELEEGGSEMCVSLKVKVDTPFARIASVLAERLRLDLPSVQVRVPREIDSQSTIGDSVVRAWVALSLDELCLGRWSGWRGPCAAHVHFSETHAAAFAQLSVDATAAQGGEILQHDDTPREMGLQDGCLVHVQVVAPLPDRRLRAGGFNASMPSPEAQPMPETSGPRASAFRWNSTRAVTPTVQIAPGPMPTVRAGAPSRLSPHIDIHSPLRCELNTPACASRTSQVPADPAPAPRVATVHPDASVAIVHPGPQYGTLRSQHAAALAVALSEHTLEPVPRASPPAPPRIARDGAATDGSLEDPHSYLSPNSSDSDNSDDNDVYEELTLRGENRYEHSTETLSSHLQHQENQNRAYIRMLDRDSWVRAGLANVSLRD